MDISVIFSTYKRPELLEETLTSFLSLHIENLTWEIILADNAGDPDTEIVAKKFAKLLPLHYLVVTKRGKNNALNEAILQARGELFVFTDDDVIVEPDWLNEIWEGAHRWPQINVFGGKILPKYPEGQLPPFDHPFLSSAYAIADHNIPEGTYPSYKVWGPNMAIRGLLFKEGWKFNPAIGPDGSTTYVMGSETDLTKRLEKGGNPSVYLPKSIVNHQIRREQLDMDWLYGRAFRLGLQYSREEDKSNISMWFGIPRCLIKKIIKAYMIIGLSIVREKDKKRNFDHRIFLWETRGRIHWYRTVYLKNGS
jgi:glycosyltransferase involved in cell wall biosynthesis